MANPTIQKYSNCIYFGDEVKEKSSYQGMLYFFDDIMYYGQLYHNDKHGTGVEMDLTKRAIFKGEWKEGKMVGPFEVKRDGEYYYG